MMPSPLNTRRWPRLEADLPVSIVLSDEDSSTRVAGRGTEISEGGMAVYAGVELKPYDLMELEFEAPSQTRLIAVVRNRAGYCFGLEFLTPLPSGNDLAKRRAVSGLNKIPGALTAGAVKIFEKIRALKGDAAAYALLGQILQSAGCTVQSKEATGQAVQLLLRSRDGYLREKEVAIQRLRTEIDALRRVAPLLSEAHKNRRIDPGLPELISAIPNLLNRK